AAASSIKGTVTVTGAGPVNNYTVELYSDSFVKLASACTFGDGSYGLQGVAAGTYYVRFADGGACGTSGYLSEWWESHFPQEFADPLVVVDGIDRTGINAALDPPATLSGTVTDGDSGTPVANVHVKVQDVKLNVAGEACTAADGTYTVGGLAPGVDTVRF